LEALRGFKVLLPKGYIKYLATTKGILDESTPWGSYTYAAYRDDKYIDPNRDTVDIFYEELSRRRRQLGKLGFMNPLADPTSPRSPPSNPKSSKHHAKPTKNHSLSSPSHLPKQIKIERINEKEINNDEKRRRAEKSAAVKLLVMEQKIDQLTSLVTKMNEQILTMALILNEKPIQKALRKLMEKRDSRRADAEETDYDDDDDDDGDVEIGEDKKEKKDEKDEKNNHEQKDEKKR